MINLVRPKFFVPIHGEYRHLVLHAKLAEQCGLPEDNIFVIESGDVLELTPEGGEVVDHVGDGYVFVDGLGVGDVHEPVLDDRRLLSRNGFLISVVTLDKYSGSLVGEPQIVTRGFIYEGDAGEVLQGAKEQVARAVELGGTRSQLAERIGTYLRRYAREETGRHPVVVPVVIKV